MMELTIYQVDAFADRLFSGNPAAVIPLQSWISEELMQSLAMENNLAETVFFVPSSRDDADYDIRWFTPGAEINLCGHATLASAWVLFHILGHDLPQIRFHSMSGILTVGSNGDRITLDFPSWKPMPVDDYKAELALILDNAPVVGVYRHRDLLVELADEDAVRRCNPDFTLMKKHFDKMIITAKGEEVDFVSRFFAPAIGIDEDPVTGSAHSQLIPFWSEKLGKSDLHARQLSKRGGELWCKQLSSDRVEMGGTCVFYMKGTISL